MFEPPPRKEHLTETEIDKLIAAVKEGRYGHRDATMVRLAYQHGLRVGELINLEWPQLDLDAARFHVKRLKDRPLSRPRC